MAQTKEERNAYMRVWRKKNKVKISEQNKRYRESHKAEARDYHKAWRDANREHLNEQAREKYRQNPQSFKERKNRYVASNQEKVKKSQHRYKTENRQKCTDYERIKRQSDPVYRFRTSVRCLIWGYAKKKGYKGNKKTWELVGCDFDTFLAYVQSQFEDGMTLENYGHGRGCWNIDHIVPISTAQTDDDVERLNHYSNLRPMWSTDNYRKSKKAP